MGTTTTPATTTTTPTTTTTTTPATTTPATPAAGPQKPQPTCPEGWEMHGVSCYLKGHPKQTWEVARTHCSEFGSSLASIGSQDEQDFVASLAGRNTWIG